MTAAYSLEVHLKGGLGNQLFQWAAGYRIAQETGSVLRLIAWTSDSTRAFRLWPFGLSAETLDGERECVDREAIVYEGSYVEGLEADLLAAALSAKAPVLVLEGYFQNERFFEGYSEEVRRQLWLNPPRLSSRGESTTVAVHVRRGDYVGNSLHEVCGVEYYRSAMDWVRSSLDDPRFMVVSDDRPWCRERFTESDVEISPDGNEIDDFRVLLGGDAFVIPNSSFSWWAAWLTTRSLVVCPSRWLHGQVWEIAPSSWKCLDP